MVAAPLLLLGGPIALLLRADPWWLRRRVLVKVLRSRVVVVLTNPITALAAFTVVLVGTHLTGIYELALRREPIHELEHVAYLVTALLFWWPAIGVDPAPRRISHPTRMLYLMVSMPVPALLGVAIVNTGHVMYSSYAQPTPWGTSALADQGVAGTLMWVGGMFTIVPALGTVVMHWLEDESRIGVRRDRIAASNRMAGAP
jgi:putative copper resistance protein D